jgi:hypothetical protein
MVWVLLNPLPAHADPVTIATVAIVMSVVGVLASTAIGVTSAVVTGKQAEAQADYQAQVNENNAKASRQAAQAKIDKQRINSKFLQGSQLAKLGGMGVTADGSTLQLLGQAAGQEKFDELVTHYEGEAQAIQFEQAAALNDYESSMANYNMGLNISAEVAKGVTKMGTSLLSGGIPGGSTGITSGSAATSFANGGSASAISGTTGGYTGNLSGLA